MSQQAAVNCYQTGRDLLRFQSVVQSSDGALSIPSHENSMLGINLPLRFLFGPKLLLLLAVLLDEFFGVVQLQQIEGLRLGQDQSMLGFEVEPGGGGLVVEGDESSGSLQQPEPGLGVEGRLQVPEEGQIRCGLVT